MKILNLVLNISFALSSLFVWITQSAYAEEIGYKGYCTQTSSTKLKGVDGLKSATPLTKSILFAVNVDYSQLKITSLDQTTKTYLGVKNVDNPTPQGEWHFTNTNEDVYLVFLKDKPPIINFESKGLSTYYWGSCELNELPLSTYVGTLYTEKSIKNKEGKVDSCGLEFGSFIKDWSYNQGRRYSVFGSFGVGIGANNSLISYLKVITNRVSPAGNLIGQPEKPYYAYLKQASGGNNSSSLIKNFDSDAPGGLFSVFNFDKKTQSIFIDAIGSNKLVVAFNRIKGSQDIEVPLDLTIASIDANGDKVQNDEAMTAFSSCLTTLLKDRK